MDVNTPTRPAHFTELLDPVDLADAMVTFDAHIRSTSPSAKTPPPAGPAAGLANLATIRAAIIAAIRQADYCTSPKAAATIPPPAETLRLHGLD